MMLWLLYLIGSTTSNYISTQATASSENAIAIGADSISTGRSTIAIGTDTNATHRTNLVDPEDTSYITIILV
ncbi:hypothetical protein D650_28315 [Mannheimia haemolytica USDA-ARS-USMARC-183]|nr:hypothetical protein D650_28315 [Mannheimia haemolytica USDA-ARS-USMARC-183]ASW16729.1 hypothetical protein D648_26360 [Mannheimia haemolytica USDA-ARS-USMARC-185]ASW37372.1 hypothetical protein CKG23_12360 [Mannheimia haemolytica]EEY12534.1 hypothetical protein COK_1393 [Mannheimia haemolytica serotype A2 str. BOVINE]ASW67201.1 hypothetical protein CKG22_12690 [Mannheimia haemolytica]